MPVKAIICAVLLSQAVATAPAAEPAAPAIKLESLDPPVLLPDGREFKTWRAVLKFDKTLYVDGSAHNASDDNPGTKARPFRTINRAAQVLQPGQRVVVAAGVYREWVRPKRGGTSPEKMISYQAAPDAQVTIKGSRIVKSTWRPGPAKGLWTLLLKNERFDMAYNPFAIANVTPKQFDMMSWAQRWRGKKPYTQSRGLVFQKTRRLRQALTPDELARQPGTYLADTDGARLHIHPFGGADPNKSFIEITTQRCVFAPETIGLGFIHVAGFTIEHAGNPYPFPQYGALSTWRGHHWLIENNTVRQVNGVGIDIGDQHWSLPKPKIKPGWHIVRGNTVTDCGVCGIQGLACHDSLIEDNLLVGNAIYPVEHYYETGGIKTHCNVNTLIRGNRIFDTRHGCGIWMDFGNINSRCTQNIIVNSRTIHGGIFIEASLKPNMIDRNIIWNTRGAGIYEHDSRDQIICHNFIANSTGPAIRLRGKVTNRKVDGQPIVSGNHTVINNIFVGNRQLIETRDKHADLASNVSKGIVASLDPKTLILTWHVRAALPKCRPLKPMTHDFFATPWPAKALAPGPFVNPPTTSTPTHLHPARRTD